MSTATSRRRSVRLSGYDYAQPGAYFVTVCTQDRESLFGKIIEGEMKPSRYGQIVQHEWLRTGSIRAEVELDAFVVMPNHIHAIVRIADAPDQPSAPTIGARTSFARVADGRL